MVQVAFPFDAVTQAQLRQIKPAGVWCGNLKGWEFPLSAAQSLTDHFGARFSVQAELLEWMKWLKSPLPPLPHKRELIAQANLEDVLSDGRLPFKHQKSGACWLLGRKGGLLADEMGLGKTLTALLAARVLVRAANVKVMVIAPAGLHAHWRNEADVLGIEIDLHSWANLPANLSSQGTLLVVDEAHFAKSLKSQRSQALLRLARHPRLRAIWMLTGTPMKNGRAGELFPLLAAIDHPLARNRASFEKHFCEGYWKAESDQLIRDINGVNNLVELRKLVRPCILSRQKHCVLQLPPKIRRKHKVSLSKSKEIGLTHRLSLVIEDYRYRVKNGLVKSDAESLAFLSALRQISAEFKLPKVVDLLNQLLLQKEAAVVFSSFIKPLTLLQNHLGGALLTGKETLKRREESVNSFQRGDNNLLLTTYGAGGLGFTLHRARHVILLERPWTPGDVDQAEDRCHRIGMEGSLTSHWFQLGIADQLVDGLLSNKSEKINIFMGLNSLSLKNQTLPKLINSFLNKLDQPLVDNCSL